MIIKLLESSGYEIQEKFTPWQEFCLIFFCVSDILGEPQRGDSMGWGFEKTPILKTGWAFFVLLRDVRSNTTFHTKREYLSCCSLTRTPGQTEIDIAGWEE